MPTTTLKDAGFTDEEIHQFIRSFDTVGDAFYFLGASSPKEVIERVRGVAASTDAALDDEDDLFVPQECPKLVEPLSVSAPAVDLLAPPKNMPSMPAVAFPNTIVVFDTETTGLKPAIVCQLAYMVLKNGCVQSVSDHLLKLPDKIRIQKQAEEVHGISNKMCKERGLEAEVVLSDFLSLCRTVRAEGGAVVAHNSIFDARAVSETCERWNVWCDFDKDELYCTMKNSKHFSPLLNRAGRVKDFRNEELYEYFYGEKPTWARLHNALDDVRVTALNLACGLSRGQFTLS
jgi:DNA polymerase III epsilon subunit-like protein